MSDAGVSATKLDLTGGERMQRFGQELGVGGFGATLLTLQPGQRGRIHRHLHQEEVLVVLEGELTLAVDGDEQTYGPGAAVRIAPHVRRQVGNRGPERLLMFAVGADPEPAHIPTDGRAWSAWDEGGEGQSPRDVPFPPDFD